MSDVSYALRPYQGTAEDVAAYLAIQRALDPSVSQQTLSAREATDELSDKQASFIVVGGNIAGFIAHHERDSSVGREGFIWELVVLEQFRRQRIGFRVMEDVLRRYAHLRRVTLHVSSRNDRAIGLYRKLGFEFVSEVTVLGRPVDYLMTFVVR
jgi:ribosomal protein S18 acetylase RimI-like enzyme